MDIGLYTYILPFLVTFIVIYGVLDKVEPFGSGQRRIHGMLAALIGLFLLAFAPSGVLGSFFTNFFGAVAVAFVSVVGVMAVAGLVFRGRLSGLRAKSFAGLGAIGVIVALALFISWGGLSIIFPRSMGNLPFSQFISVVVVIGIIALLGWALAGGSDAETQE